MSKHFLQPLPPPTEEAIYADPGPPGAAAPAGPQQAQVQMMDTMGKIPREDLEGGEAV